MRRPFCFRIVHDPTSGKIQSMTLIKYIYLNLFSPLINFYLFRSVHFSLPFFSVQPGLGGWK